MPICDSISLPLSHRDADMLWCMCMYVFSTYHQRTSCQSVTVFLCLWVTVTLTCCDVCVCMSLVHITGKRRADLWQYFSTSESPWCCHFDVRFRPSNAASGQCTCCSSRRPHNGHHSTTLPRLHQPLCTASYYFCLIFVVSHCCVLGTLLDYTNCSVTPCCTVLSC